MQVPEAKADTGRSEDLSRAIGQARMILAILATGSLVFAAIVLGLNATRGPILGAGQILPQILAGLALVLLTVGVCIGVVLTRRLDARARNQEEVSIEQITGSVVVSAALVEGPSLLATVAALLGGVPYLLITLVGAAALLVQWLRLPDRMRDMAGLTETTAWHHR